MSTEYNKVTVRYLEKGDDVAHDITNQPLEDLEANIDSAVQYTEELSQEKADTAQSSAEEYTDNLYDQAAEVSQDLIGFDDRGSSTLSFDSSTRTVSLSPIDTSFSVWNYGREVVIDTTKDIVIDDVSGVRYVIYNPDTGNLEEAGEYPGYSNILVAYIYWNVTNQQFVVAGDERHNAARDTTWHMARHIDIGAVWRSGGSINYTLDDSTDIQLGIGTPLKFADEDLEHEIVHSSSPSNPFEQILEKPAEIPVMYINGNGEYVKDTATTVPYKEGTNNVAYNSIDSAGNGIQVDTTDGKYVNYFIMATNSIEEPVISIQGRFEYDTQDAALGETIEEYSISLAEFTPMYRITLFVDETYSTTLNVHIDSVEKLIETKFTSGGTFSATDHEALTGRSNPDQHPASSIDITQTSVFGSESNVQEMINSIADTATIPTQANGGVIPETDRTNTFNLDQNINGNLSVNTINNSNTSNWDTAYDRSVTGVSGSGNGTLTINQQSGSESANLSHTHTKSDIPSEVAYEDESNTFTGSNEFTNPVVVGDSTNIDHATRKDYVDSEISSHSNLTGNVHGVPEGEDIEWQTQAQEKATTAQLLAEGYTDEQLENGVTGTYNMADIDSITIENGIITNVTTV